jgi:hypothetical protein
MEGAIVIIGGLVVLGLSLFLYNLWQAYDGWRMQREIAAKEKRHKAYMAEMEDRVANATTDEERVEIVQELMRKAKE